jgi:hypothetical protein
MTSENTRARSKRNQRVGWVERSETHRCNIGTKVGFACAQPTLQTRRLRMAKRTRSRGTVSKRKTSITIQGRPAKRAERMTDGRYRLVAVKGARVFVGTLIDTINKGKVRLAIFSVPKG